eukprot:gnl/TRDRNA2_/TRDRNA2_184616_c0_seq1.p1 gnl/TRDRNA2_/TRDRNA2_184616_c0~~gnl/TRDRNA2_/TRDRNA2_184616_c0_seq1.p1  ORF type:complete len:139 (+),score=28.39 gnl/TRDRNA2_/TRDRNA2_184616_c0_seq1:82-498(+)
MDHSGLQARGPAAAVGTASARSSAADDADARMRQELDPNRKASRRERLAQALGEVDPENNSLELTPTGQLVKGVLTLIVFVVLFEGFQYLFFSSKDDFSSQASMRHAQMMADHQHMHAMGGSMGGGFNAPEGWHNPGR